MTEGKPPVAQAPWLWFVEPSSRDRALDLSGSGGGLADELAGHFSEVEVEAPGRVQRDGLPESTFDCIVVHDTLSHPDRPGAEVVEILGGLRRALRPGGVVALASVNPHFIPSWFRNRDGVSPRTCARRLTRAGFGAVCRFYLDGSLEQPGAVVPDTGPPAVAYEGSPNLRKG
ncbi:MAG: class I SAM-dependent methyltransferase, partial [Longimicrobiales bacterium]|nr:class I SAM-dependent methyltransferase [Longimicrobiales bacterium]